MGPAGKPSVHWVKSGAAPTSQVGQRGHVQRAVQMYLRHRQPEGGLFPPDGPKVNPLGLDIDFQTSNRNPRRLAVQSVARILGNDGIIVIDFDAARS